MGFARALVQFGRLEQGHHVLLRGCLRHAAERARVGGLVGGQLRPWLLVLKLGAVLVGEGHIIDKVVVHLLFALALGASSICDAAGRLDRAALI